MAEGVSDCGISIEDAGPLAVSDEAVLDCLFAPEYGKPDRRLVLPAFNARPQFVQKLVEVSTLNVQQAFADVLSILSPRDLPGVRLCTGHS